MGFAGGLGYQDQVFAVCRSTVLPCAKHYSKLILIDYFFMHPGLTLAIFRNCMDRFREEKFHWFAS